MNRKSIAIVVGIWGLPLLGVANAQQPSPAADVMNLSPEQLKSLEVDRVYGASKLLQEVTQAPASVTIIKAREIRELGCQTLADVLRGVRGLYVTYDRNYSYLGVRGFANLGDYNSRVLLLIDGHRTNDNIYDGTYIGSEFPLDVALIDRIEIVRGPSSSLYGTSAFLTVINVITKDPGEVDGFEGEGMIGTLGSRSGRVTFGHRTDRGLGVVLSATAYHSDQMTHLYFPEFDGTDSNGGYADDADTDQARKIFSKVSFGDFTVQGTYGWRRKRLPTASYGTIFNDPSTYTLDTRGYLDALYARQFRSGTRLVSRVFLDVMGYSGDYPYTDDATTERIVERDAAHGRWWGAELMLSRQWRKHAATGGFEYRHNFLQEQSAYLEYADRQREDLVRDRRTSSNWALYAQDEYRIARPLTLVLGFRHDRYSTFGGSTNGRLGRGLRADAAHRDQAPSGHGVPCAERVRAVLQHCGGQPDVEAGGDCHQRGRVGAVRRRSPANGGHGVPVPHRAPHRRGAGRGVLRCFLPEPGNRAGERGGVRSRSDVERPVLDQVRAHDPERRGRVKRRVADELAETPVSGQRQVVTAAQPVVDRLCRSAARRPSNAGRPAGPRILQAGRQFHDSGERPRDG